LDFNPLEIHFLAGVVDKALGECAVEDESADHVPVTEDLEYVGGLLVRLFECCRWIRQLIAD